MPGGNPGHLNLGTPGGARTDRADRTARQPGMIVSDNGTEFTSKEIQMKKPSVKPTESNCPACNGTGYPVVMQLTPGRKIYPAPCKKCGGKGRISEAAK